MRRRGGVRPSASARQTAPPRRSLQVTNTSVRPSALQLGWNAGSSPTAKGRGGGRPVQRHQVDPAQSREGHRLAVGRDGGGHDQPRPHRPAILADVLAGGRPDRLVDVGKERQRGGRASSKVDPRDPAAPREQDGATVRREGVTRNKVLGGERLDLVVFNGEGDAPVGARREIPHAQFGLPLGPRGIGEHSAVHRHGGPKRRAGIERLARALRPGNHARLLAGHKVAADDGPLVHFVQRSAAHMPSGIEEPAVRRDRRAQGAAPRRARRIRRVANGDQQGGRSVQSEAPQFVALQVGPVAADVQRPSVGRPSGRDDLGVVVEGGDRARVRPVRVHHPQVLGPRAVADKGDALPVRREGRPGVEGHAGRERQGRAAARRHRVEMAEEIEHDRPSVRRDVERHPRPRARVEGEVARRGDRQAGLRSRCPRDQQEREDEGADHGWGA